MPEHRPATEGGHRQDGADGYFGPLASAKYLLLTTFKPDGVPVSTHVHGLVDGDRAYFRTWHQSGTAERLRHTDEVQVTACPVPGVTVGQPLDAIARLLPGEEARWAGRKLAGKYPLHQRFLIPLLRRARRGPLAHYELLSYEEAEVGPAEASPAEAGHTTRTAGAGRRGAAVAR